MAEGVDGMSRMDEMIFIRNHQTNRLMDVTADDVACWSDKRQYIEKSADFGFWGMLGKLLLAGFCLMFALGCSESATELTAWQKSMRDGSAEAIEAAKQVEKKQDASIVILRDQTAALLRIETKLEASLAKSEPQNGKDGDPASVPPDPPAKANTALAPLKVATPGDFSHIASDGTALKWNIEGNWNPTILETSAHLAREHGIDTNGMTHQQMADIHAGLHDGKPVAIKAKPTVMVNRGSDCPGGVCPTSTRTRKGLFGWRR
jgi:hypothetical protein